MNKLFSTAEVHPRDRFDYWHDVACENLVGHSSRPASRRTFEAEIECGMLADIGLVLFENSPMQVARTARHIGRSDGDDLLVCRQVAGGLALEQDDRQVTLEAGDVILLDPLLPYVARFSKGSKMLVLKVPRRDLEARVGRARVWAAMAMKPSEPTHCWMSSFLGMLPDIEGSLTPAAKLIARDQTLDLVATSVRNVIEASKPRMSSARSLALLKVRAAIEMRLTDPYLDAAAVAEAAGISVRYANALLANENTSIMRLAHARRMARCRETLADPLQNHRTVSEIAYGWGFSDMTHFGRSFKARYDVLPRDYRKTCKAG
jgi:AraC family transcriptional regulator, positive regulator of tynA and feaB